MFAPAPPGVIAVNPPAGYSVSSARWVSRIPRCSRLGGSRRGSVRAMLSAAEPM